MKHARVVHRLSQRIRLLVPALVREAERSYVLEILLRKHPAVRDVKVVVEIGSLTVRFDPVQLPEARLLATLDAILGNLKAAPKSLANPTAKLEGPISECSLAVEGMTCASCALLIEMKLQRDPRVHQASVNFAAATVTVHGVIDREGVGEVVKRLGYEARPMDTLAQRRLLVEREKARVEEARKRFVQAAVLTAPVMVSGMLMHRSPWLRLAEFGLSTAILFGSSNSIFKKAWMLAQQREANMDTLIAIGAGAAWAYSVPGVFRMRHHVYFESAAGICTFVLLGRYMEERAKGKASEAVRKLIELQPETAIRLNAAGHEETISIDEVQVGDVLRVRAGDKVPSDGRVLDGESTVNEAMLTGESAPVHKSAGDTVLGGCLNGNGSFTLQVSAVGGETVLSGIVRLVDHAQGSKLPVQKLADRISARFVPAVGAVAGVTFVGWLLAGHPVSRALSHSVAVLLIACPCALGLATPTAIMVGTGQAAKRGIFIRHGEALEKAAGLTTLVFDKTGTLTAGTPAVTDVHFEPGVDEGRLASVLEAAEAGSEHFLARALSNWARVRKAQTLRATSFAVQPGRGVKAEVEGQAVVLGNAAWLLEQGIPTGTLVTQSESWAEQGKTPVYMAVEGQIQAIFAIADPIRPDAPAALAYLRAMGLDLVMATGDVPAVARYVAQEVGIDEILAQCTPADKLSAVRTLQSQGRIVGMVGDGINDAPALTAADVGMAIGGGADIAVEAAGMTLVGGDIARVAAGVDLSRQTMSIIRQNLFWAMGYNAVAIPFAAAGRLNPMIAAAAMAMSSVSVVANSLRLQRR